MLPYTKLKRNRRKCVALTGMTPKEFSVLLPAFARASAEQYPAEDVGLYLNTLLAQDPETWGALRGLRELAG